MITCLLLAFVTKGLKYVNLLSDQARNEEFLRAGEFSRNKVTSTNIYLQRKKVSGFFAWKLLKIAL